MKTLTIEEQVDRLIKEIDKDLSSFQEDDVYFLKRIKPILLTSLQAVKDSERESLRAIWEEMSHSERKYIFPQSLKERVNK